MPEKTETTTMTRRVQYRCDNCEEGYLVLDKGEYYKKYIHICDNCGKAKTFPHWYPRVETETPSIKTDNTQTIINAQKEIERLEKELAEAREILGRLFFVEFGDLGEIYQTDGVISYGDGAKLGEANSVLAAFAALKENKKGGENLNVREKI